MSPQKTNTLNSHPTVAMIGNPNCGKTTLFNGLTGSNQHIGNWPGVTVEKKSGFLSQFSEVEVLDLPGTYSLHAGTDDEMVAREQVLYGESQLLLNVVDASHLERNLLLTMALLEMNRPMAIVLTMSDIAASQGIQIHEKSLSKILGVPVLAVNALDPNDIQKTAQLIHHSLNHPSTPPLPVSYPHSIQECLQNWNHQGMDFYQGVMILEEDQEAENQGIKNGIIKANEAKEQREELRNKEGDAPDILIATSRYDQIASVVRSAAKGKDKITHQKSITEKIDSVALHPWFGIPLFLVVIYLLFWTVTQVGGAFIDFFDILFGSLFVDGVGALLVRIGAPQWLQSLLAEGVGVGIQTVATFIPVIFSMFFMLSLLEDSGYMARASFVMDRFMRIIGLPGKAFVPMLVGFGCTVPAIMATRTLENRRDRYLTVFLTPFMSCGARLPVYALFGAAFFGARAGLMVFTLYLGGVFLAILTGLLLKKTLFKGEASHFAMELPPYHPPRLRPIMKRTWFRLKDFVTRAGQVIIIAVLVLSTLNSLGVDGSFGNEGQEKSVLATACRTITPVFSPMGIERENWPATLGLVSGLFAKEAIVGTMNSLYGQNANTDAVSGATPLPQFAPIQAIKDAVQSVQEAMKGLGATLIDPLGLGIISTNEKSVSTTLETSEGTFAALRASFDHNDARAYAYLIFVLIYAPCIAAMGAIIREIGPRFGALAVTYLTVLAWSTSTLFFQIAEGHQMGWILLALSLVAVFVPVFNMASGRWKHGTMRRQT
ncbi:MAG: ferrous iron transport protein B [Spirochaetales bacterium]|nr:ferrous iron transport protein B [Spirochaetales bacterium]